MLLVKSKELRNLSKKITPSPLLAGFSTHLKYFIASIISVFCGGVHAQEESSSFSSSSSILSVFLSLLLVIAIIFALAYVMRRFNVAQAGNGQMKVIASMMAGNKEKIMVVEVGDEQYLLGITAHNINHLATLNEPLNHNKSPAKSTSVNPSQAKMNFQQKLVNAMAQTITGNKPSTNQQANSASQTASKGGSHD